MYDKFEWINEMVADDIAMELSTAGVIQKGVNVYSKIKNRKNQASAVGAWKQRDTNLYGSGSNVNPYDTGANEGTPKKPFSVSGTIQKDRVGARYQNDKHDISVSYGRNNGSGRGRLNLSYRRK
jgi:hypothetical protein